MAFQHPKKVEILRTILLHRLITRQRPSRNEWVHPLNQERDQVGEHLKVDRMYKEFPEKFFEYTRMSPQLFDKLVELVGTEIAKHDTKFRDCIPVRVRLYVTLRYFATGDHIGTIATSFSMGKSTVWSILQQCLTVIWEKLSPIYVKWPQGDEWYPIMEGFDRKTQFPNLLGAIDRKHISIQCPPKSGSLYLNYKGTYSIILMATCDFNYRFTYVDVGGFGKQSDGGVLSNCSLGKLLDEGKAGLPCEQTLPDSDTKLPCVLVGDEAFPLTPYMMRPYAAKALNENRRVFNYRLSRARRMIENAFGIMATRFRVFRRVIPASPHTATKIVLAAIALHNFLKTEEDNQPLIPQYYCPPGYADSNDEQNGLWRQEPAPQGMFDFQRITVPAQERMSKNIRETFLQYFVNEGALTWQNARING